MCDLEHAGVLEIDRQSAVTSHRVAEHLHSRRMEERDREKERDRERQREAGEREAGEREREAGERRLYDQPDRVQYRCLHVVASR